MSAHRGKEKRVARTSRRNNKIDKSVLEKGVYANSRLMHAATSLIGCNVEVNVRNGGVYEGIFRTISSKMDFVLEMAHKVDESNHGMVPSKDLLIEKVIFEMKDVVCIAARNVDLDYVNKDTFTDSAISSKVNANGAIVEKELTAWEPDPDLPPGEALEHNGGWDVEKMFDTNKRKFNIQSTYDPSLAQYTTQLRRENTAEWKEKEAKALELAREIEGSESYRRNMELENGDGDEESRYSAVIRNTSEQECGSTSKYVPPHLRRNQNYGRPQQRGHVNNAPPTHTAAPPGAHNRQHASQSPTDEKANESKSHEEVSKELSQAAAASRPAPSEAAAAGDRGPASATAMVSINNPARVEEPRDKNPQAAYSAQQKPDLRGSKPPRSRDEQTKYFKEFSTNFKLEVSESRKDGPVQPQPVQSSQSVPTQSAQPQQVTVSVSQASNPPPPTTQPPHQAILSQPPHHQSSPRNNPQSPHQQSQSAQSAHLQSSSSPSSSPQTQPASQPPAQPPAHASAQQLRVQSQIPKGVSVHSQPHTVPVHPPPQAVPVHSQPQGVPVQPQGMPGHQQPQAVPVHSQSHAAPVHQQPQAVPVQSQPHAVPVHSQSATVATSDASQVTVSSSASVSVAAVQSSPSPVTTPKDEKEEIVKKSVLNPNAKEWNPNPNAAPFVPKMQQPVPAATPPRPSTQSPAAATGMLAPQSMPAGAYTYYPGHPFMQASQQTRMPKPNTSGRVVVAAQAVTGQPLLAQAPGQPMPYSPFVPNLAAQSAVPMYTPQMMVAPRMITAQQQGAEQTHFHPQGQPTQTTVYYQSQPSGANMGSGAPHLGSQPAHIAPHQHTPPHSTPQQVSIHPSPSPIQHQVPPSHPPPSSGTPQPAYVYQQSGAPPMGPNGQQNPPLQPSPHTPTSPQSMYPQGVGFNMQSYGASHLQQQQQGAGGAMQPSVSYAAHSQPHSTQVTHSHHQQHTHLPQAQPPQGPQIIMMAQPHGGGGGGGPPMAPTPTNSAPPPPQPSHMQPHNQFQHHMQGQMTGQGMMPTPHQVTPNQASNMHPPVHFMHQAQMASQPHPPSYPHHQ